MQGGIRMQFKYGLEERPPFGALLLFGLQWLAIAVPGIIIIGKVAGGLSFSAGASQVMYVQKLCFITALTLFCQVLWGHRLPLVAGPSTVLLIGVIASRGFPLNTVYSSIFVGGLLLTLASVSGLFRYLQSLFTVRVVAVVLLLIAFSLAPTIRNLIVESAPASPLSNLVFALLFLFAMFLAQRRLSSIWKSTVIVWAMAIGSVIYSLLFGHPSNAGTVSSGNAFAGFFTHLIMRPSFDPGVLVSFLFCFLALSVNDLGSIQSMYELIKPLGMPGRLTRGIAFTGLANAVSGFFGVLGPVDFSLSSGVVASSGCASRFTLLPTALILLLLAFSPLTIGVIGHIPPAVIGCVFTYILCAQVAAGLSVLLQASETFQFEHGLIVGLPVLLATIVAFLDPKVLGSFPVVLRPILGNAFVVGVVAALVMEHLIFRPDSKDRLLHR
jgi:xanthine/uracil permease